MKIIQVAPYFQPHIGGVESHVLEISKELHNRGHEVLVFTSRFNPSLPEVEKLDGVSIKRIKPLVNIFTTPVFPKLRSALIKESCDVVHAHIPPPFVEFFSARACNKTKIPLILTYHCDLELPNFLNKFISGFYRRTFGHYSLIYTNRIVVTTNTYAATSRSVWHFKPIVIPNAVNSKEFNPKVDGSKIIKRHNLEGKKVVLYVGRIKFHKGIEYFVSAAKFFGKDTKFLIVGTGDFEPMIKNYISTLNLTDRVIMVGRVPYEELKLYYAASDVFVLPSLTRLEAFGIVGLEAMASGKPVIVSDIPGVREVITDGQEGFLTPPMEIEELAKKIKKLLSDPDLRKKMGSAGRKKVVKYFEISKIVDSLEKVYGNVTRKGKPARV
jgi:glycosyltransferase involved in cell wall biosynthesis